jgi:hypothetical protein
VGKNIFHPLESLLEQVMTLQLGNENCQKRILLGRGEICHNAFAEP